MNLAITDITNALYNILEDGTLVEMTITKRHLNFKVTDKDVITEKEFEITATLQELVDFNRIQSYDIQVVANLMMVSLAFKSGGE